MTNAIDWISLKEVGASVVEETACELAQAGGFDEVRSQPVQQQCSSAGSTGESTPLTLPAPGAIPAAAPAGQNFQGCNALALKWGDGTVES